MSQYLIDQIEATPNITVLTGAEITAVDGDDSLREITISIATSAGPFSRRLDATGLYVFIGAKPCTEWLNGSLATDAAGFLLTGRDLPDDALGHGRRGATGSSDHLCRHRSRKEIDVQHNHNHVG